MLAPCFECLTTGMRIVVSPVVAGMRGSVAEASAGRCRVVAEEIERTVRPDLREGHQDRQDRQEPKALEVPVQKGS